MAKRVLVVDDDWETVRLVEAALAREGYEVASASNEAEGFLSLESSRPGPILLDVTMPVLDGYQVLRLLRGKADTGTLPVIMLTAERSDHDVTRSLTDGADLHLSQPFGAHELAAGRTRSARCRPVRWDGGRLTTDQRGQSCYG